MLVSMYIYADIIYESLSSTGVRTVGMCKWLASVLYKHDL